MVKAAAYDIQFNLMKASFQVSTIKLKWFVKVFNQF